MSPDGVSERAGKVYAALKEGGFLSEAKMADAERVTHLTKLPKGQVLSCLQELEAKGYVRRKARDKAAGYFVARLA